MRQDNNPVGFAWPPDDYSAYDLLNALGADNVARLQRYNRDNGTFETAAFDMENNGQKPGADFMITAGEGYIVNMKNEIEGFKP